MLDGFDPQHKNDPRNYYFFDKIIKWPVFWVEMIKKNDE